MVFDSIRQAYPASAYLAPGIFMRLSRREGHGRSGAYVTVQKANRFPLVDRQITKTVNHLQGEHLRPCSKSLRYASASARR